MRVLCLTDFVVSHGRWLWDWLPDNADEVDFVTVRRDERLRRFNGTLAYFWTSVRLAAEAWRRVKHRRYDVVVGWEIKNSYSFALLRAASHLRQPKFIILAFGLRGLPARWPTLTRFAMRGVDAITVPSAAEVAWYADELSIPLGQVFVCPIGHYDLFPLRSTGAGLAPDVERRQPVVFSGGYSRRDFDVLLRASRGLGARVRIIAPKPRNINLPANVEWTDAVGARAYAQALVSADLAVIPLQSVRFAVGLVDLLSAMSAAVPTVVTRTAVTAEYVKSNHDGILVDPGDVGQMREAMQFLAQHADERARIGANARETYLAQYTYDRFARRVHHVVQQVVDGAAIH